MTFGELIELVTYEAPAAVGAFLRARFVPTPEQIEATMERIGEYWTDEDFEAEQTIASEELNNSMAKLSPVDLLEWYQGWQAAHEKRMRAMG